MRPFRIKNKSGEEFVVLDIIHYKNMDFWRVASLKDGRIDRISSENIEHRQEDYTFTGWDDGSGAD